MQSDRERIVFVTFWGWVAFSVEGALLHAVPDIQTGFPMLAIYATGFFAVAYRLMSTGQEMKWVLGVPIACVLAAALLESMIRPILGVAVAGMVGGLVLFLAFMIFRDATNIDAYPHIQTISKKK